MYPSRTMPEMGAQLRNNNSRNTSVTSLTKTMVPTVRAAKTNQVAGVASVSVNKIQTQHCPVCRHCPRRQTPLQSDAVIAMSTMTSWCRRSVQWEVLTSVKWRNYISANVNNICWVPSLLLFHQRIWPLDSFPNVYTPQCFLLKVKSKGGGALCAGSAVSLLCYWSLHVDSNSRLWKLLLNEPITTKSVKTF